MSAETIVLAENAGDSVPRGLDTVVASPVRVTFVGMDAVEAARQEVRAWLPRLGVLTDQVTGGQVVIEAVDEHRGQRNYRVRMELALPDGVVVVTLDHPSNGAHEDLYVAIRNAFRAARRQLEGYFKTRIVSGGIDGGSQKNKIDDIASASLVEP